MKIKIKIETTEILELLDLLTKAIEFIEKDEEND